MLLEAVQKPQKVPRSLSAYQEVRKRAHAGAPSPCTAACMPGEARRHVKGHVYVHLIAVIMSCHMYDWYRIYSIYGLHIKVEGPSLFSRLQPWQARQPSMVHPARA